MSFNLDDLLNDALNELDSQEKQKTTPVTPPPKQQQQQQTQVPKPTTPTTATPVVTNVNNNTNNNNKVPEDFDFGDLSKLSEQFTQLLKSNEFSNLLNGDNDNLDDLLKNTEALKSDSMTPEEQKQITEAFNNLQDLMKNLGSTLDPNAFNDLNKNNNNNNNTQQQQQQQQQQAQQPHINIEDFEKHFSESLKGIADNASKQTGNTEQDMLQNLFQMFSNLEGGSSDQVDYLFEESITYILNNYPDWIEKNKNSYSPEEVQNFRKQSQLFKEIFANQGNESSDQNQAMFDQMSQLGNLPEAFCDEYIKSLEQKFGEVPNDNNNNNNNSQK
ncbi:peroxin 19 [Tieghemostelium lacteum]|uniref:Peroxin 19 n=1 Tax=Tieghemostelium lacteum TaxID=361077 RepID=A0A151ZFU8_TIELA|nr:peroxin 19 [Tieghemostelium lacteum]|eukprot:KYQ92805.1 peroxin 19 [Tieghemostelium lacteum]